MRLLRIFLTSASVLMSQLAFADEAADQALRMLEVSNTRTQMEQLATQMLELQIQQKPMLAPYKETMSDFFHTYMGYEALKDDLVRVYTNAFTADELRQIADFQESEVGIKANRLLPQLSMEMAKIAMERISANVDELDAMIQAETDRIRKLQSQ